MRAVRYYPFILILTVFMTGSILLFVSTLFQSNDTADSKKKIEVGLVGDFSESYLDVGIMALKNLDSSQYYVELTEMEEEEAKEKLADGTLHGYILIPEGFVESIVYGENKSLTYVAANSPATLGPTLMNEVIQTVSQLVIQGQNGIYGMIEIAEDYNVSDKAYDQAIFDLNVKYIDAVLDRENFYELTYVGLGDGISFKDYYICAFFILLLMLWGMASSSLLIKHDMVLPRVLKSGGYQVPGMVFGDYIPFLFMICLNTFLLVGVVGKMGLFFEILPVVVMITAMQFLLYEMSSNMISGVLLQLFVTVLLSYASGLFYPIYSLPAMLQKWSNILPTRVAFDYLSAVLTGKTDLQILQKVWIYIVIFAVISITMRQYKMRSNKYD